MGGGRKSGHTTISPSQAVSYQQSRTSSTRLITQSGFFQHLCADILRNRLVHGVIEQMRCGILHSLKSSFFNMADLVAWKYAFFAEFFAATEWSNDGSLDKIQGR